MNLLQLQSVMRKIRYTLFSRDGGFTIVELLIVIVVIAILAAIAITAYAGVQVRAQNNAKTDELVALDKLYESYKAVNGVYPIMPDGGYCLGTGFPDTVGDGKGHCRDIYFAPNRYSENATLYGMIKTIGAPTPGPRSAVHGTMGPYVEYHAPTFDLIEVIQGTSANCPSPTQYVWDDGTGMLLCAFILNE